MEEPAGESGMDTRKASVHQNWFVSKTIKWLTPIDEQGERHGEKILTCCHISLVVHKTNTYEK